MLRNASQLRPPNTMPSRVATHRPMPAAQMLTHRVLTKNPLGLTHLPRLPAQHQTGDTPQIRVCRGAGIGGDCQCWQRRGGGGGGGGAREQAGFVADRADAT